MKTIRSDEGFSMLTTKQAAAMLGITPRRAQDLVKTGKLKADKVSGVWLIDEDSVNARLRTVSKTGGRPRRGAGAHDRTFTLMNRTHEVTTLVYDTSRKDFTSIGRDVDLAHAPLGLAKRGESIPLDSFRAWWRGRGIPSARIGLAKLLETAQVQVPEELIQRNLGLSLSDQYWIRPEGSSLKWEDINFFNNAFDKVSVSISPFVVSGKTAAAKPDNTSDGNLEKYWTCEGPRRVLHKSGMYLNQEPFNEVVASALHRRLLDSGRFVPYSLEGEGTAALSVCDVFLTDEEEYVPALYVNEIDTADDSLTEYERYIENCSRLGIPDMKSALDRMIVCDDILANRDRHWRNFGIIRNVNTLVCRPAPIFDSGSSLWCDISTEALARGEHSFESAQFYSSPAKQMLLVEDMSWFDGTKLEGFVDEAIEILAKNDALTTRLPFIREALTWRVERMIDIAAWN